MPVSHESVVFDVHDCKVYPVTADASGSAVTFGAAIDVPGIFSASLDPNFQSAELKGDAQIIAKKARLDKFGMSLQHSKLSIDVLKTIFGGTTTDTGTTPNQTAKYVYTGGTVIPYFAIGVLLEDVDAGLGCIQVILFKSQVTGGSLLAQQSDQFGQPSFDVDAFATSGTVNSVASAMLGIKFCETKTALPSDPSTF